MSEQEFEDMAAEMGEHIRSQVFAGFRSPHDIAEGAIDMFYETDEKIVRPLAERLTQEAVLEHQIAQASWPEVTDCDRLDDTFAELNQRGIVCRQDFSCCGNCGVGEIHGEMEKASEEGVDVRGYAFYHMQDTDAAVAGSDLLLYYGATQNGEVAALSIAREIVNFLELHGLAVDWNGRWDTRIRVKMDWKRWSIGLETAR